MSNLKYLIDLMDDDSPEVQEHIISQLENYGLELERDIKEFSDFLDPDRLQLIRPIIELNRANWLKNNFFYWRESLDEAVQLESFMKLIGQFQLGFGADKKQTKLIDELAQEFKELNPSSDQIDLANFLFQEKEIRGSDENYYDPFNSNLVSAIQNKNGLPITLAILFIVVGGRLGFNIEGCNFPGHFLAKIYHRGEIVLIDCFSGGRLIFENDLSQMIEDKTLDAVLTIVRKKIDAPVIVRRVLNNLINAYDKTGEENNKNLFTSFLTQI
jgi:hypothetical protein